MIETAMNDIRISMDTGRESPIDASRLIKKEINKNTALIIPPQSAPHGRAARLFRTAAKPEIK